MLKKQNYIQKAFLINGLAIGELAKAAFERKIVFTVFQVIMSLMEKNQVNMMSLILQIL